MSNNVVISYRLTSLGVMKNALAHVGIRTYHPTEVQASPASSRILVVCEKFVNT
jgi:hypothetical protein